MARDPSRIPWRLAGLGLELGMMIGGLAYLGYLADRRFDTSPWLTLTGVLTAMVGGCYALAKQVFAESNKRKRSKPDPP
jgi:F0F1-type ATP synthase assembly protein I